MEVQNIFGLVGKNIDYSFSKTYFLKKFDDEGLQNCNYLNFDIESIANFKNIVEENPLLSGLNVTIPYKEIIIPLLDKLSKKARKIGAVNVIRFTKNNQLKGYNSDYYGFKKSLAPLLKPNHKKALILGTGGASKAVVFALKQLGIDYKFVSRSNNSAVISYKNVDSSTFEEYQIVVNCTPLGTFPDIDRCPEIPFSYFTKNHIAFDLIYNPQETLFLKKASEYGAVCKNGQEMLVLQAEKSWRIWNK